MGWFERDPDRLQLELDALAAASLAYRVNDDERERGRTVLEVTRQVEGANHTFTVVYPDQFPHFAFTVIAPESLPLTSHINPYARNLCLLSDVQQTWRTTDTAADFLTQQLDQLVAANRDPDTAGEIEAHDAELVTGHLIYFPDSLLITANPQIPEYIDRGYLTIAPESADPRVRQSRPFRGAMLAVFDESMNLIVDQPQQITSRYSHVKPFKARWIRLPEPPKSDDGYRILDEAIERWPGLRKPRHRGGPDIIALYIPEQIGYRAYGYSWIPVVRQKFKQGRTGAERIYLCRPNRAELASVQARVPHLQPLAEKTVLAVGLGALGSMAAWQLARAGIGSMRLVDGDVVEVGNTPRWLLGFQAVGLGKSTSLASYLAHSFPYLVIEQNHVHRMMLGDPNLDPATNDAFYASLENVDLILDASAEWCVNDYLSTVARERGIPYVWATATPGACGGIVGRMIPRETPGCWECFQWALGDGTFVLPPEEGDGHVQPPGCALPTFTGAGFDLDHIALGAVRLAVATLCRGAPGYPDFDWDIGVCAMWNVGGTRPITPTWTTYPLLKHERCICDERQ